MHKLLIGFAVVAALAGCGDTDTAAPGTPERALADLTRATNDHDDDAIKKLVCKEKWLERYTFEKSLAAYAELDPRLGDLEYEVRAGEVRDKTETTAVGVLELLPVENFPDDLSDETQAALANLPAPIPIWLIHDNTIDLVKENGTWVAC